VASEHLRVVAIDFGASSIRVCRVELGDGRARVETVHRYEHAPVRSADGHWRWDWSRLIGEVERGLERAVDAGPVASIGVDTWGVDYGLLDHRGELLEPPFSYRDARTNEYHDVVTRVGAERLWELTGLQELPFNTIFQLAAHDRDQLARASTVLMLPELVVHHLTGAVTGEFTSAGTTGLLRLDVRDWSDELCDAIGIDRGLLPELQPATTRVGAWRGVPVHLVGGHDTASAVFAGAARGDALESSGTWLIVGCEQDHADLTDTTRVRGFSNEQGVFGDIRLVRNVAGWWLVEECRRAWGGPDLDALLDDATAVTGDVPIVDVADERFLAPPDMDTALREAGGLDTGASRAAVIRTAVESMAASTADVVASLPSARGIRVFGGGARSELYLDALRRRSGLRVTATAIEATALGNALVQGVALGVYSSPLEARATQSAHEQVAT